jgi:hypothetical protein
LLPLPPLGADVQKKGALGADKPILIGDFFWGVKSISKVSFRTSIGLFIP